MTVDTIQCSSSSLTKRQTKTRIQFIHTKLELLTLERITHNRPHCSNLRNNYTHFRLCNFSVAVIAQLVNTHTALNVQLTHSHFTPSKVLHSFRSNHFSILSVVRGIMCLSWSCICVRHLFFMCSSYLSLWHDLKVILSWRHVQRT